MRYQEEITYCAFLGTGLFLSVLGTDAVSQIIGAVLLVCVGLYCYAKGEHQRYTKLLTRIERLEAEVKEVASAVSLRGI